MYDIDNYYNATTLNEALSLMKEHPDAKVIAGGSDVLIKIREGKMAGCELIGIRDIKELSKISMNVNGDILIGAMTTFSHVSNHELVKKHISVLGKAVDQVGGPQVRNVGTIGGNVCNGAVSADSAPTLFSLNAKLRLISLEGERIVPITEFYLGPGRVDLRAGELLAHIIVPQESYHGYAGHYIKYSMRKAMDIATLGCSIVCKVNADLKQLEDVRITFGVAAPTPLRCYQTEAKLKGKPLNDDIYQIIEASVREEINPRDSWRASKAFRLQVGGEIAKRALEEAIRLWGGECDG